MNHFYSLDEGGGLILASTGERTDQAPAIFSLSRNFPNPFNPLTTIGYSLPSGIGRHVMLKVYDILGREVATLVDGEQAPGAYAVHFSAGTLASGIYFYTLSAGKFFQTRSMILMK